MSNKHEILELLRTNELTVKEIAERTQFNENEVRVYIHRLLEDNLVKDIGRKNRWILYTAAKKDIIETSELVHYLDFLNEFFKDNIDYLLQNPRIDKFIEDNENIFNKIEMVTSNA